MSNGKDILIYDLVTKFYKADKLVLVNFGDKDKQVEETSTLNFEINENKWNKQVKGS